MSDNQPNDHFVYQPSEPPTATPPPPPSDHFVYQPRETPTSPAPAPVAQTSQEPAPLAEPIAERAIGSAAFLDDPVRPSSPTPIPRLKTWLPHALLGLLTVGAGLTAVLTAVNAEDTTATAVAGGAHAFPVGKDQGGALPTAKGMHTITYKKVTIQVPKSWTATTPCTSIQLSTVVVSPGGNEKACNIIFQKGVSEVIIDPLQVAHEPVGQVTTAEILVDGHYGQRTVAKVPTTGQTYATLFIADVNVNIAVMSPNVGLVNRILASARVDPSVPVT